MGGKGEIKIEGLFDRCESTDHIRVERRILAVQPKENRPPLDGRCFIHTFEYVLTSVDAVRRRRRRDRLGAWPR